MFELTYNSLAIPDLKASDIQDILETSQAFNSKNEITGCLLYHKGQFTQILEGHEDIIQELYSSIKQDKRHSDVKLLYSAQKEQRIFTNWSLAYLDLSNNHLGEIANKLFEENLLLFSQLADKPTIGVKVFWEKVRQIIQI